MMRNRRWLCILLAALMLLSLAACGKNADESGSTKADPSNAIGSILLSGETRVRMYYDKNGKVVRESKIVNGEKIDIPVSTNQRTYEQVKTDLDRAKKELEI